MAQPFLLENGHLSVPLHILQMPGGRLPVPNRTKEILVEIGTNSFDTWDTQVLPRRPGAFLVSFEPLVDKWALMLSRNARSRVFSPLGWHNPRGVILPFAVSDRAGIVPFHVSPRDGCSSLRPTSSESVSSSLSGGSGSRARAMARRSWSSQARSPSPP